LKLMSKDIRPNEKITTFFALESMELRKSKKDDYFLELGLYDRTGKIKGYLWKDPIETADTLKEKSFVRIGGTAFRVNGSLIINIERIRTAEKNEINIRDFLDVVPEGINLCYRRLLKIVESIKNQYLRALIDSFLKDDGFIELFIKSPGGLSIHHSYIGGLLEHTANIMSQAVSIADKYPDLIDKDLLLTGSFLHDIGKTQEIYWEIAREYTTEGKLLGHIGIGLLMLEEKLRDIKDFPYDLSLVLRHMILSHHGEKENGSPIRPATPEAIILHIIDNADARINHLYNYIKNSDKQLPWTQYNKCLSTEIYKMRSGERLPEQKENAAA